MSTFATVVTIVALLMNGAMAGVFFAFSTAVMPGLDALKGLEAVAAMQSMNRKILNPRFLMTFVGAWIVSALAGVLLLVDGQSGPAVYAFAAAAVYLVGSLILTGAVNVPMNNAIDAAGTPAGEAEAAKLWASYSPKWTRWNTLRGWFCAIAVALLGVALLGM